MSRYFLTRLCVEGFRGINNEGEPLELKFKPGTVNSVFAINGTGKSSLFDALCYAICGDIPKLGKLQAAEKPEDYYANKFHSTGNAIIILDFESDGPSSQKVSIQVQRSADGRRTVTSSSGQSDPEAFLESMNESFTLLDYETFSKFIDHTPLERGRSFSSLLGLAEYSDFRQTLKTAIDTRALTADLDINIMIQKVQMHKDAATNAVAKINTNFKELTGKEVEDLTMLDEYRTDALNALAGISLLSPEIKGKVFDEVDFEAIDTVIKAAEGGKERANLADVISTVGKLNVIKDDDLDVINTEIEEHNIAIDSIIELYKKTKGNFCRQLYASAEALFVSGEWENDHECPLCGNNSDKDIKESVENRLQEYKEVDAAIESFQKEWISSNIRKRLKSLEELVGRDLDDKDKLFTSYDASIAARKLSKNDFVKLKDYYDKMEARYLTAVETFTKRQKEIEEKLPKSLVALTKQVEYAKLFRESSGDYDTAVSKYEIANKTLANRKRWQQFITDASNVYAESEADLAKSKITAIESEFKEMFASIMGVDDIKPNLERNETKEDLQVQLGEFHGLKDVSARALLSESYRNALAISVYLSAAINHQGVPRFIVLDDITSSFDSGHQINLMEFIRTRLQHPENAKGLQFIILSHDGIMRKYFDGKNQEPGWNHQSIEGNPPGVITTQSHDGNRVRTYATNFLSAGQVDIAQPWARQYLEFTLMQIIRRLDIPVPIDFAIKDHNRMVSSCLDAIKQQVALHATVGDIILEPSQLSDFKNTFTQQLISNWVSHYETSAGTSISAAVMLGVLDNVDKIAECFKYDHVDQSGAVTRKWYKNLTTK